MRWVDSGAPLGRSKGHAASQACPDENTWQLAKQYGEPDLVIKSTDYTMPAVSQDQWWKPMTRCPLTEARWVRAVEMRPGTIAGRRITHHAIGYLIQKEPKGTRTIPMRSSCRARRRRNPDGMGGWQTIRHLPSKHRQVAVARREDLVGHPLHAVGEKITDHVELAVYLYPKGEVPKYRTYLTMFNAASDGASPLDIPPNTVAETEDIHVLKQAARLENFQPHMHLRGKAMLLEAILPDGTVQTISYCNNFNFNWMNNYIYTEDAAPVFPKGTIIHVKAWHDNTTAKASNPDPNQWVGWGDRTVDEMAHAWVNVTYISQEDYNAWAKVHRPKKGTGIFALLSGDN